MRRHSIIHWLIGVLVVQLFFVTASAVRPVFAQSRDAGQIFGLLPLLAKGNPSQEKWEDLLTRQGLEGPPSPGVGAFWYLSDNVGTVRATAFFVGEPFFLMQYFPTEQRPLPDPLLAHLLARSEATVFEGGGNIEIVSPSKNTGDRCEGTSSDSFLVQLAGGALVRTGVVVKCKQPAGD